MALILCPECGHQVSDKAEICPNCGIKIAGNVALQQPQYVNPQQAAYGQPQQPQPQARQPYGQTGQTAQQSHQQYAQVGQQPRQPQAGGMGPQGPDAPQAPVKKSSKKVWIISLIIALAICGLGYYFYNGAQEQKEQEDYEYAMQSTDPMVLETYLARYAEAPQEHRDSVTAHLQMLQSNDTDWTNAMVSGSRGALQDYIDKHPDSPHCGEARNKIDSIDYAIASRTNTADAYSQYLKDHPDGKYANEAQEFLTDKKNTEVQPEDMAMVKSTCRHFFQAINSRSESKLLSTVTDYLTGFLNLSGASGSDVVSFMNKLYKEDITNMNWHLGDDFKVDKIKGSDDSYTLKASFSATQDIERTDPSKENHASYVVSVEVTPEGKIQKFTMKKKTVE